MKYNPLNPNQLTSLCLMTVMAMTRFGHFGSAVTLPDASLAVFFLAGFGVNPLWFFGVLLLEAGLIDYVAVSQYNVSDFCLSPAYLFLIPAYGVMWFAGRHCQRYVNLGFTGSLKTFGLSLLATTLAFILSNTSFYGLSDKIGERSISHFLVQFGRYYPAYLSSTMLYLALALVFIKLWKSAKIPEMAQP